MAGRVAMLFAAASASDDSSFSIGGDLPVNRLGFGAMRLTGEGIWGWPPDRENALKVLRRAVEVGQREEAEQGLRRRTDPVRRNLVAGERLMRDRIDERHGD